jgi:hypothetical protein
MRPIILVIGAALIAGAACAETGAYDLPDVKPHDQVVDVFAPAASVVFVTRESVIIGILVDSGPVKAPLPFSGLVGSPTGSLRLQVRLTAHSSGGMPG